MHLFLCRRKRYGKSIRSAPPPLTSNISAAWKALDIVCTLLSDPQTQYLKIVAISCRFRVRPELLPAAGGHEKGAGALKRAEIRSLRTVCRRRKAFNIDNFGSHSLASIPGAHVPHAALVAGTSIAWSAIFPSSSCPSQALPADRENGAPAGGRCSYICRCRF